MLPTSKTIIAKSFKSKRYQRENTGRSSKGTEGILFDTVDGGFWKTFPDDSNNEYFSDPRNLGGILNIDWFEPFENVQHSCGVIYMALLNLPREIRFKWENVIVGCEQFFKTSFNVLEGRIVE